MLRSTVQRTATSIRVERAVFARLSRLRKRIELNQPNSSYLEFKAHCQVIISLLLAQVNSLLDPAGSEGFYKCLLIFWQLYR